MASKKNLNSGAAAATAKLFSGNNTPEEKVTQEKKATQPKSQAKNDKVEKQVFSFRGEINSVKAWRLYATISGIKVDDLGSLAMQEFIAAHPLKGAEKALFDEKMKD